VASRAARRCRDPRQARSADRASRERHQRDLRHRVRWDGSSQGLDRLLGDAGLGPPVWMSCSCLPI